VDELHVGWEAKVDEVRFGAELGGGEDAAFVALELSLKVTRVEVGPPSIGFGHAAWLADKLDVVTEGNDEEVFVFFLEFGEGGVDGNSEKETSQGTTLLATNRVHDFTQT
jgi:hypothetical protein